MKISDYTRKPRWQRRLRDENVIDNTRKGVVSYNVDEPMEDDNAPVRLMTNKDFLDELKPTAHKVYSHRYRSQREIWEYDEKTGENVFVGYEDVYRTSMGLQEAIRRNKATICHAEDAWFGNEFQREGDEERLAKVKSWWNVSGMNRALQSAAEGWFGSGDAALYLFLQDGRIHYRVFSYETGSNCTLRTEPDGSRVGVRKFVSEGRRTVELYRTGSVEKWQQPSAEDDETAFSGLEASEDGYYLVRRVSLPRGFMPFHYHREPDVPWGPGQQNCDDLEQLMSDGYENGKFFFFPILFLKGMVTSLPEINHQGKTIGAESDSGDAKLLAPPDASNVFDQSWERSQRALLDATGSVMIRADELKGQNDSAAYLTLLFFPETQWAKSYYARLDPFMQGLLRAFTQLVGFIEGDIDGYEGLVFSYYLTPFIPKNLAEEIQNINNSLTAGSLSGQTARSEHPLANPNEEDRYRQEKLEEQRQAQAQAQAQQQTE